MSCAWTCLGRLIWDAVYCAAKSNPATDPAGFALCMVDLAKAAGCRACVCEFICEHHHAACSSCKSSDDETMVMFATQPTFSISNNLTSGAVLVDVIYDNSVCNKHSRPIAVSGSLDALMNGCGPKVTITAITEESPNITCTKITNSIPFPDVAVLSTATDGSSCAVQNA